jgi:cysteine desulfurase
MKRIYLDYAASTPIDPNIYKKIKLIAKNFFGNPGSLHYFGQKSLSLIDEARQKIANIIGANFDEIIFTSSATEANNLALRGSLEAFTQKNKNLKAKIIVSKIEHESILETAEKIKNNNHEVFFLNVDKNGQINLNELKQNISLNTVLVSIIYANNETGIIQPILKIGNTIKEFKDKEKSFYPLFHIDASQAFQFLDCNVKNLGIDLMTLSSHKIYGPKGAGLLYIKKEIQNLISPQITGGEQEFGFRSSTENVYAIYGFALAMELAFKIRQKEFERIKKLRNYLWNEIKNVFKKNVLLNQTKNFKNTLPNILNIHFLKNPSDELITALDLNGIAVSTGSACKAHSPEPSKVLLAYGFSPKRAKNSIRISLGKFTSKKEIDKVISIFKIINKNN